MQTIIAHLLILGVWIFNITSMIPQILLSYRLKSGTGISDWMLLANLNGFMYGLLYTYGAHLPLIYKVFAPISCSLLFVIIMQRIKYSPHQAIAYKRFLFYFIANLILLGISALVLWFTPVVINPYGWTSLFFMTVYQIPQIAKIVEQRTTYGFSFTYATFMTISATLEMIAAFILGLPLIVKLNGVRALWMYLILCVLFMYYPSRKQEQ